MKFSRNGAEATAPPGRLLAYSRSSLGQGRDTFYLHPRLGETRPRWPLAGHPSSRMESHRPAEGRWHFPILRWIRRQTPLIHPIVVALYLR
jgi:hypothetical protein